MTDYGHELKFGSFITPVAQQADAVVALAQISEAADLDLVTFQDHPYQSDFLDTWTLLSFVAARTSRIALAGNVLNLPLRPPSVLARAVASLDLLSHGRAELGLGAGAFWDGVEAMGGDKLTPGEAVTALEEGMDIIRGIWDAGEPGGVRFEGKHYHARGARRGPLPEHRINIWLGALKPRMLSLVGRKADGWLPSLSYIKSPTIAESNAIIDGAATEAGREPREIRRMINLLGSRLGPDDKAAMIDQITELALEHGFSTFILPGDSPAGINIFGKEVAPAVREAVAKARKAAGTPAGDVRSAAALALRSPGIDYESVPDGLAVVEPGDHGYSKVRSSYIYRGAPGLVINAKSVDDVTSAIAYARKQDVPLAVRSGGHGISGRSTNDGGIVLDVSALNEIKLLDAASKRVRLGPGARWADVAEQLAPHGLGMSSGDYGNVGVGGLATAGGIGWLSRKHGLTIDHVVAAEIALTDGRHLRTDKDNHADLFWAIRGAGGNFGVVTALELEAYDVGDVVFAQITYDLTDADTVIPRWADAVINAPRDLTSFMSMVPARSGNPAIGQASIVIANPDPAVAQPMLQPFLGVGPILGSQAFIIPYPTLVDSQYSGHDGQGGYTSHSGLLTTVTPAIAQGMGDILRSRATNFMQLRAVGGAVNDVAPDTMAYAHRHQNFALSVGAHGSATERLESLWPALQNELDGLYISFETATGREHLERAFPGRTLQRLRGLKAQYDPTELFNANFNIPPQERALAAE
ncbi:LLM class flavin-dependent oxidoreductase [Devosia ginsengisoli]|uniref:LLM class flavin-dependent oxidoreductase n=1 Tax=Devosia ginsengisoli TaxID=400770 RepID=UPI0026F0977B|nr:LLM class flavin-dependent oxidoreductase [Devosia ginsengisoli]MCR6671583.1 LLM class flavin-dependent oxidoreductase [Devosia ginsengisoli]